MKYRHVPFCQERSYTCMNIPRLPTYSEVFVIHPSGWCTISNIIYSGIFCTAYPGNRVDDVWWHPNLYKDDSRWHRLYQDYNMRQLPPACSAGSWEWRALHDLPDAPWRPLRCYYRGLLRSDLVILLLLAWIERNSESKLGCSGMR